MKGRLKKKRGLASCFVLRRRVRVEVRRLGEASLRWMHPRLVLSSFARWANLARLGSLDPCPAFDTTSAPITEAGSRTDLQDQAYPRLPSVAFLESHGKPTIRTRHPAQCTRIIRLYTSIDQRGQARLPCTVVACVSKVPLILLMSTDASGPVPYQ